MVDEQPECLLVSAGNGPKECNLAVAHILARMQGEADVMGLELSIDRREGPEGLRSAVVLVHGPARSAFSAAWRGTIQWRMKGKLRRHHKRSNWFVGVFAFERATGVADLLTSDVAFSTLRAGGPGGQHQNTTDSAVRAVHRPTGLAVVVRDGRSQHRNKALALARLRDLLALRAETELAERQKGAHRMHQALERGNPVRVFVGEGFDEQQ